MRGVEFYGLPVLWIGNSHPIYDLCTGTHPCCWWSWLYIVWFIWEIIELGAIPQYLHVLCVTNICTTPTWKTISKAIYRVSTLQKTQTWKIYHKSQLRHDFPNLFSMLLGGVYKRHQGRYRHLAKMGSSPSVAEPSPRTDALELQVLEKAVQHKVMPEACPVITSCSKVGPVISGGPHPSDQNVGIESWTVGMGF